MGLNSALEKCLAELSAVYGSEARSKLRVMRDKRIRKFKESGIPAKQQWITRRLSDQASKQLKWRSRISFSEQLPFGSHAMQKITHWSRTSGAFKITVQAPEAKWK